MELKVLGAGREVGRSGFILEAGEHFLLDYGVKLTPKNTEYPLDVKTNIKAMILSHAHLDHSGYLPHFYEKSHCINYMTSPTLDVSKILWADSIKIASHERTKPPFTKQDCLKTERFCFPIGYKKRMEISPGTQMEFFDAGHILGSAMTKISHKNKSFLYTGDYNPDDTRLFTGADLNVGEVDYVLTESTYGNSNHPKRAESESQFIDFINETVSQGGTALVPALAVGRAQEMIDILYEHRKKLQAQVFFDGMGQAVAKHFLEYPEYLRNPKFLGKALHSVKWVQNFERKKVTKEPCIIVTSSGMLQGGPSVFYLKKLYHDKRNCVALTCFQVPGTAGRTLLDEGVMHFENDTVKVNAAVKRFDFSSHADQKAMMKALNKWSPEKIVCVHGDTKIIDAFIVKIKEDLGIKAVGLKIGEVIKLGD